MASATVAALMVNTGTPEAARSGAVRHFLRRFLSDPRVIELPRVLWLPLLYGLILPLRAPRSARKYREIWREEGSPLLLNTSRLREALARELGNARAGVRVEQAFLYSPPFVAQALDAVRTAGIRRLIVLPLYPQSSGSTTGAVYDQVAGGLRAWRAMPELRVIASYFGEPEYIDALASSVREHWSTHGRNGHLLMSFHGIPQSYVVRGDRYAEQCRATAALSGQCSAEGGRSRVEDPSHARGHAHRHRGRCLDAARSWFPQRQRDVGRHVVGLDRAADRALRARRDCDRPAPELNGPELNRPELNGPDLIIRRWTGGGA